MRIIVLLHIFILSTALGSAQNNLVINGSFENVNGCPWVNNTINESFVYHVSNPANYTPDYLNMCYTILGFTSSGVPSNSRGYQIARTGNAYIGLDLWEKNTSAREYIQLKFNDTLKQGHHYAFTCYVNMANKFRYATANFGAYFSVDSVSMPAFDVLPFVPQIENPDSNILTDTLNWMPITGTYLANGGEQYVLLGNFKPVAEGYDTAYQYYGSPTHANWAYYYIDDVSLIDLDSTLSVKENEAMAQVEVFPNPASSVLTIKLNEPQQQYSITDIKGNTLLQNSLSKQEKLQIDISALPSGFYVINLINKLGYISREKFVKM
jgi:hypothetical protein